MMEHIGKLNLDRVSSKMLGYPLSELSVEEKWMGLSTIKKESSLNQTLHSKVKRSILDEFIDSNPHSLDKLLGHWEDTLQGRDIKDQVDIIEKSPLMNFMTALEHKRWNNFYYMRGFTRGAYKDEREKLHDCLIDDWDEFLNSAQRDKAIYDFLSSLSLKE